MKNRDTRTIQEKSEDILKGKFAEVIVAEMLTRAGYVVRQLGYEHIMQDLDRKSSLWQHLSSEGSTIESTPDLAILNNSHHLICFLEVKYRETPHKEGLIESLEKMSSKWQRTHVMVVTPQNPSFAIMYKHDNQWNFVPLVEFRKLEISTQIIEEFTNLVRKYYK